MIGEHSCPPIVLIYHAENSRFAFRVLLSLYQYFFPVLDIDSLGGFLDAATRQVVDGIIVNRKL